MLGPDPLDKYPSVSSPKHGGSKSFDASIFEGQDEPTNMENKPLFCLVYQLWTEAIIDS